MELADTTDLKSVARKGLRVRVPPRPPYKEQKMSWTKEQHKSARVFSKDRGVKSRILGEALDEIERLEVDRDKLLKDRTEKRNVY